MRAPSPSLAVAVIGAPADVSARHDAAIAATSGLYRINDDPTESERTSIVVICHPHIEERVFACEQALEQGRFVLCQAPPAASAKQARRLAHVAATGRGVLQWEAPPLYSGFADAAQRAVTNLGAVLYMRLQLLLPQSWLADGSAGIIDSEGLWVLPFVEEIFGTLDSVAAHTRALVRTERATEDIALAHVECIGGVEGTIELHALGEEALIRLEAFGPRGSIRVERDLHTERLLGLRRQYQRLRELAQAGDWQPMDNVVQAVTLARWLRQSARLGVRLHRRDQERS